MKKLLIIGASILQLPAIKRAKELGYYVGVADYNPNAIGISYADEYFNVSTIDVEGVIRVAKAFQPDGIMTLATDMPMRAVAAACQELGLSGISFDTALKATDKGEMIKAFKKHNVEHPWFFIISDKNAFDSIIKEISYPCIIKPTDNAGSRGVMLCHDESELINGYSYASHESRTGGVIIEEYLQGPEFSVEVMVVDGVPHVLQITDKITTGAPHFVEMGHTQPTMQPDDVKEKIEELARRAVLAVGINIGPAHVEMILTKQGPKMVELGARMGGDCISTHLVPLSTGIDMVVATIRLACGEEADIVPKWNKGAAIRYFETPVGVLKSFEDVEKARIIPGVAEISFVHDIGETVGKIGSSIDRIGFVIAQGENAENAASICEQVKKTINIEVEEV